MHKPVSSLCVAGLETSAFSIGFYVITTEIWQLFTSHTFNAAEAF